MTEISIPGEYRLNLFLNQNKDLNNNRLFNLPFETQLYIFEIHENNMVNIIINKWYNYLNKKIVLCNEINSVIHNTIYIELYVTNIEYNYINPIEYKTLEILKKCNKILNGRENIWWLSIIIYVINGLMNFKRGIEYNNFGTNATSIYYSCESLICNLLVKFNVFANYYIALDNYYLLYDLNDDILNIINEARLTNNFDLNNI